MGKWVPPNGLSSRAATFTYDKVDRLLTADYGVRSYVWTYDAVGNRLTESLTTHAAQTTFRNRTFAYNPANQLTQVSENGQVKAVFGYDEAGNAVTLTEGGITHRYVYDHRQQLIRAVNEPANGPPAIVGEYDYDFAKRRIGRNGIWSVYNGDDLLTEFGFGNGEPFNSYTQGHELISTTRDGKAFADAQGSVTLTENGTSKYTEYDAFGEVASSDASESRVGYTGQFYDAETGLQPLGNGERYYFAEFGQFIQEDVMAGMPGMPGSLNRYAYAHGNPLRFTDPSGNGIIGEIWHGVMVEAGFRKKGSSAEDYDKAEKEDVSQMGDIERTFKTAYLSGDDDDSWTDYILNKMARGVYHVWNFVSFGALGRQEKLVHQYEQGKIGGWEYVGATWLNQVEASSQLALTVSTAGVGGGFGVGGRLAIGAVVGVADKFAVDTVEIAAGMRDGYGSASEYLMAAVMGGAFNAAAAGGATGRAVEESAAGIGMEARAGGGKALGEVSEAVQKSVRRPISTLRAIELEMAHGEAFAAARATGSLKQKVIALEAAGVERQEALALIENGYVCFVAGTQVHTDEGLKNIEEIKVGDTVKSYNERTGKVEFKEVTATFQHQSGNVLNIFVEGEAKAIRCTPQHPFFVKQARGETSSGDEDPEPKWIEAGEMKSGDRVMLESGKWVQVIEVGVLEPGEWVYNFTVAENHTYFVGTLGLLVHNTGPDCIRPKIKPEMVPRAGGRTTAINRAWALEKELIQVTGEGTRAWTQAEKDLILSTRNRDLLSVMSDAGYTGHHINSVEGNGLLGHQWQGDGRNIVFLQNHNHSSGYNEHVLSLQGHRGHTTNSGRGRLIDRRAMIERFRRTTGRLP